MMIRRFWLGMVIVVAALVGVPSIAAADCIGPTISYRGGEVEAGDQVVVEGSGWGDNCYDGGPPPEGEGFLGVPLVGLEVFLVQDGTEILVATGDADAAYEFEANITIPSGLSSGKFEIVARASVWGDAWSNATEQLVFIDSDVVVEPSAVSFEPSDAVLEVAVDPIESENESNWLLYTIGAAVLVLAALAASIVFTRRSDS